MRVFHKRLYLILGQESVGDHVDTDSGGSCAI